MKHFYNTMLQVHHLYLRIVLMFILFTCLNFNLFSQARLGVKASEIRKEFSDPKYNLKSKYEDGNLFIEIELNDLDLDVVYMFNSQNICKLTAIIPHNDRALNTLVDLYNKEYVPVSKKKWRMYSKNGIAKIELIFTKDGYYFVWTEED